MATLSLYLFVAGGLALAFAFACHVAYTTILAQSGVAVARRGLAPAGAAVGGGSATVTLGGSGVGRGQRVELELDPRCHERRLRHLGDVGGRHPRSASR